jgi:Flp pilus assembly protein TadD
LFIFSLLLVTAANTGCTVNTYMLDKVTAGEQHQVLSGFALFGEDTADLLLPEEDILGLDGEMISFIEAVTAGLVTERRKLPALLQAIVEPDQLALKYDDNATFTARETFRQRRANCLSFTTLIVPMLRHLGMQVGFNDVKVPPVWDLRNTDMLILYRHVNAMVTRADGSREVVDFNLEEYESYYPQKIIPDRVAEAQYYNNKAIEFLLRDDVRDAFRYLRKAIDLAPQEAFLWVNMGALYRKQGQLHEAEIAFRQALAIEPDNLVAISNIERVYLTQGKTELAGQLRQIVRYHRNRNPYYLYTLAMDSYAAGEYAVAENNIKEAIRRYPEEHRFYFLQGAIYNAMGETGKADISLNKAIEFSRNEEQEKRYRRKIDMLF